VAADPDYDLEGAERQGGGSEQAPESRGALRDLSRYSVHFSRLPGTRAEGEHIAEMLGVAPLEGEQATKGRIEAVRSPRILHLATHGFFLPERTPSAEKNGLSQPESGKGSIGNGTNLFYRMAENPLLRSGIVLAGVNAWLHGKPLAPGAGDGILSSEDASGLDLLRTDLVVLSACETGLGDIRVGEGVFGLRRAFFLAGAKTILMSLWKIPDEQTRRLMEDFYRRLLEGEPRSEALREAQLAIKASFPAPLFWGAFICQGDPGPLPPEEKKRQGPPGE
jgi:CHAT domain-containing protein